MKLSGFKYLANQGVENIWKNKMMAFATFCVLLISLLLVGCAALFYINMNSMILGLGNQNEIAVYLTPDSAEERVQEIQQEIQSMENVDTVDYISKEEAYKRMQDQITSKGKPIFDRIDDYQFMPDGFSVTVKDNDKIEQTTALISQISEIQSANSSPQVAEFLRELRRVVTLIAGAIIIALAAVSMIMISNTTKASVFARREEIQIMKYVGATNSFIRTPFFVEGMVTGFFAGAGAFFITWAVYRAVYRILTEQAMLMNAFGIGSIIPFGRIRLYVGLAYLLAGCIIGALGSVISTRKHLDV
ncbi:permease-like cell division protein FtsX [Ruminococcus sp. XPD3002]|uniref:permease-like cell division protein FtsX n=1 Tax=Ruminococcus sp. XPD3002 TaxID=1452269 RepID=UPI000914D4B3|nr:permease-like cell division protein FtsX [Ruminococcus sp.]SFX33889.1 cell division transport system permease protein [Ruminococcus flavefaciens]HPY83650.1 permease-like cell division protein FtsX [Ruminococcus flavefaciens]HRU97291.1 permease-like cell division protein FtsX [Ruminococcus sp.]